MRCARRAISNAFPVCQALKLETKPKFKKVSPKIHKTSFAGKRLMPHLHTPLGKRDENHHKGYGCTRN